MPTHRGFDASPIVRSLVVGHFIGNRLRRDVTSSSEVVPSLWCS